MSEYVAFSLRAAREVICSEGEEWRSLHPEVFNMASISKVVGLVLDDTAGDVILVGQREPARPIITLDDFVVALKARLVHCEWPMVSIDPTPDTQRTKKQSVRFAAGIRHTHFGQVLFDADYLLKRIGLGIVPAGISGFESYWEIGLKILEESPGLERRVLSRFWFYPVAPSVAVRANVASIGNLKIGVFTEVLSASVDGRPVENLSARDDPCASGFAYQFTERMGSLANAWPALAELQSLCELVAMTKAIEEMAERPDFSFWLREYQVLPAKTLEEAELLTKSQRITCHTRDGMPTLGYWEVSGGVQLAALALRLKAGEPAAIRDVVLATKPAPGSLFWTFLVAEWVIPTSPEVIVQEDVVSLFIQATFLQDQKRLGDALSLYDTIIRLRPEWPYPRNNRGNIFADKGELDLAIADYDEALRLHSRFVEAYYNRGNAYSKKGMQVEAIRDYSMALQYRPCDSHTLVNRGIANDKAGNYDLAISDFTEALEHLPENAEAYTNRGLAHAHRGQMQMAVSDYNHALQIIPKLPQTLSNRGLALSSLGEYQRAVQDLTDALEAGSEDAKLYNNRGAIYLQQKLFQSAIIDFNRALTIDPRHSGARFNRGTALKNLGRFSEAIRDFTDVLLHNGSDAAAFCYRGLSHIGNGDYSAGVRDLEKAVSLDASGNVGKVARETLALLHR
ncbi:MAG: tetratricopeptide repeat protein [Sedimentisphaerales bacterium]|nr:tetratricopeptide repeat protein [Sedimentisphaerales bacterium]